MMIDLLLGIFSAFGLSASAGLNAYIPLMVIAVIARYTDWFTLQAPFDTLTNPWIMLLLGALIIIELLADSVPAVNHINDAIQTFIRPAAGAVAFASSAQVLTDISPVIALACGLLIAGGVHTVKATAVRPAVTATTGGTANPLVSIAETTLVTLTSILSLLIPILAGILLVITLILLLRWLIHRHRRAQAV